MLTLEDIHLGYPGRFSQAHPVHKALASLKTGDTLTLRPCERNGLGLFDKSNICIARLSQKAEKEWAGRLASVREIRVLAMVCRKAEQDTDETRRERCQVPEWQIPLTEVVFENP